MFGINMFWIEMLFLLVVIYFGIKYGGVALGLLGGLGVSILVFVFRMSPGNPPIDVMLIILAVVTTSAILEATGALNLLVQVAEKVLRKNPKYVTYLAPCSTFFLTMLVGTGHAVYPLLPVIYDVSYRQGIRPERPLAIASVASQMGITASPIAAAAAVLIAMSAKFGHPIALYQILMVTIPAGIIGMLAAATWSLKRGKDLSKDPIYLAKMQDPEMKNYIEGERITSLDQVVSKKAKISLRVFLIGLVAIITVAMLSSKYPGFLPTMKEEKTAKVADKPEKKDATTTTLSDSAKATQPVVSTATTSVTAADTAKATAPAVVAKADEKPKGKPMPMAMVIQFMIFAIGAIILFLTNVKPKAISDSKVFNAGMIAVIMIFGIAWCSDTVIDGNKPYIISLISDIVKVHPWTFAIAMFIFSAFLKSQAATLTVMLPLAYALGLPNAVIIGCIPACYAYFFFCFYPSDLATIGFDRTGTTKIGKYILNHSFMIPGFIGVGVSLIISYILANYVFVIQ